MTAYLYHIVSGIGTWCTIEAYHHFVECSAVIDYSAEGESVRSHLSDMLSADKKLVDDVNRLCSADANDSYPSDAVWRRDSADSIFKSVHSLFFSKNQSRPSVVGFCRHCR